jgi:hypothetical protein
VLVTSNRLGRRSIATDDPEPWLRLTAKAVRFSLDGLAENVGEGNAPPAGFTLEHGKVIGIGRHGGAPARHCI